ncbi:N-acetylneuraminate synthase family protein [candidate division KSB1 bacterium]|nr:N-acetylneuraminate synthase family protein [candidate division KSB1 bacterium]
MSRIFPSITIGNRIINCCTLPYIIAEIGVNHEGSIEKAKELITLAREGGADAVKFQTYKAETLASQQSPAYWDLSKEPTASQYELFQKYDKFGEKEYELLAEYCRKVGIDFLSTPFDDRAVEFLFPLVSCFKAASADITNYPLLRKIAKKGKPVLLSTGASTLAEIESAITELEGVGCESLALLHCILNYPTPYENANLNMIQGLCKVFPNYLIGYSDHTVPDQTMLILTAAYLKGARIIEKHFTYDRSLPGNDHYHAMDVNGLKRLKENFLLLQKGEGITHKYPILSEMPARKNARRSIVLREKLNKGTILTEAMITPKRPACGISPIHWNDVIGRKVVRDLPEDHILCWEDLSR